MTFASVIAIVIGALVVQTASAADIQCGGAITQIMADHPSCGGNLAFKTTTTGSAWLCSKSKEAGALLLAAQATEKQVLVYIEGGDVSGCATLPNYRQISYLILLP